MFSKRIGRREDKKISQNMADINPEIRVPEVSHMHSPIDSESYVMPILGRTKIDIWECYARHVLQFIDSDKYGNLAYSDKPDLIDRAQSLGIEVTASQSQDSRRQNPSIPNSYTRMIFLRKNAESNLLSNVERISKKESCMAQMVRIRSSWLLRFFAKSWTDSTLVTTNPLGETSCLSDPIFLLTRKCFAKRSPT